MAEAAEALPQARIDLAACATYEIEEIISLYNSDTLVDPIALTWLKPMLVRRIKDLNSVIMSIVGGDDVRETEEMRAVIDADEIVGAFVKKR